MRCLEIFTDASVNPQVGVGYGAYLLVTDRNASLVDLEARVRIKRFARTSSTQLELQTLLCALDEVMELCDLTETNLRIFTDSQNIISLPTRKAELIRNHYYSRNNKLLSNHQLYAEFYRLTADIRYRLVKVKGHQVSKQKNQPDRLFTLVDRASRRALREEF